MTTRSLFTGAIKTIEALTQTFTITSRYEHGPFSVRIPEGGLLLGAGQRLTLLTAGAHLEGTHWVEGQLAADGQGWDVTVPDLVVRTDEPGAAWQVDLTITVTYAVPA
ncbi:hypothetical protein AB0A77_22870 [Streptomyces varsoviensis]|uniref:hypothetical protein n=1 Tax=Streptomyces varsoviensis TaxID=67373 RepID=UPI0033CF5682